MLFATGPLFIALFEKVISRVQLLPQTLVALVLTFVGVILLAGDPQEATLKPELIIGLMAGVFNAGSQLGLHRASKGTMTGTENNAWTFLLASIILMPVALLYHTTIDTVQFTPALTGSPLLYLAIFLLTLMIVNTQVCRYKAYKTAETNTQVAPLIYTNLIFTAVFQFALFDTSFTSMQLLGIGLIVLGNLIPALFPALLKFKRFHIRQSPSHSTSI
ncbi:hypothetical protein VB10N_37560 [Vibrio sp. 10N]|nr:hypothetical protein VB10N_37560 [Vibrio sp. 10N]